MTVIFKYEKKFNFNLMSLTYYDPEIKWRRGSEVNKAIKSLTLTIALLTNCHVTIIHFSAMLQTNA